MAKFSKNKRIEELEKVGIILREELEKERKSSAEYRTQLADITNKYHKAAAQAQTNKLHADKLFDMLENALIIARH